MELTGEEIKHTPKEIIYDLMVFYINSIYQSFRFINIAYEDYKNMVLVEIEISRNMFDGRVKYSLFLSKRIKIRFPGFIHTC